ncbi:MAG: hypothetical protein IR160_04270 [Salinibacterium sp.]|nr:hypothetical protein [Salinibacterium sp.]MBF0671783.1 hypothetical protein [Salinibacterium sp.]
MTSGRSDWIAPTGVRAVEVDALDTAIPDSALSDPRLSLAAKGLYALLLAYQSQPIDPYDDAIEDEADIRAAIEELIESGYAVRVER